MSKARLLIEKHEADDSYKTSVEIETFGNPKGLPKDVHLSHNAKVVIKWIMDEEHKSWGISSLRPSIPNQAVELTYIESTEDEDIDHSFIWEVRDAQYSFSTDAEIKSLQVLPITLEIDFIKNSTNIIFQVS